MPAEVENMVYNIERGVPWHGLGVPVIGLMTAEDCIVKAGLDWTVEQRDIVTVDGIPITDKVAQIRSTDNAYLGTVGKGSYATVQNREAFGFANAIVAEDPDRALYDTAGSLKGGRTVFLSMDLTAVAPITVAGDEYKTFLLIANGHDGFTALHAAITPVRVVCQNTLNAALSGVGSRVAIRHTGSVIDKLATARNALGLSIDYAKRFEEVAAAALAIKFTDDKALALLRRAFRFDADLLDKPEGAVLANHASTQAFDLYQNSDDLAPFRGTGWGVLNAAAEFIDHRPYGTKKDKDLALDQRMQSIVWGSGQETVGNVLALISPKLVPVAVAARANRLPVIKR